MNRQVNCIKIKEKNNHSILNSIEISQGGSNTASGSKESNVEISVLVFSFYC